MCCSFNISKRTSNIDFSTFPLKKKKKKKRKRTSLTITNLTGYTGTIHIVPDMISYQWSFDLSAAVTEYNNCIVQLKQENMNTNILRFKHKKTFNKTNISSFCREFMLSSSHL